METARAVDRAEPQVAVIIRTKNEAQAIERCLAGVFDQQGVSFEVVIVDSGSTDSTLDIVAKHPCKVVRIDPSDFTYGRALNEGVRATTAPICAALSAHAYPFDRNWLRNMVEPFQDERVAGVVGKTLPLVGANPFDRRGLSRRYHTSPVRVRDEDDLTYSNANAAWRRSVWESMPFDEVLSGSEDLLWAKQVRAAGYIVVYRPDACVHHSHDESPRELYQRFYRETLPRCLIGAGVRRFTLPRLLLDVAAGTAWDWLHLILVRALRNREGLRRQIKPILYAPVRRLAINYGRFRGSRDAGYPDTTGIWGHPGSRPIVALLSDYYPPFEPGGAERSTQRLAGALAARGEGVLVITPSHGLKTGCADEEGVLVCRVRAGPRLRRRIHPPRTMGNPIFYWRFARKAYRILKVFRPKLIHAQNVYAAPAAVWLGRRMKIPSVVTVRDFRYVCPIAFCLHQEDEVPVPCGARKFRKCLRDYEAAYGTRPRGALTRARRSIERRIEWWDGRLRRLALVVADGTVFVGKNLARVCLHTGAVGKSHRVIYNLPPEPGASSDEGDGAALERLGLKPGSFALFVGRFSRGKGAQTVVEASRMLGRLDQGFVIAVAGSSEWPVDRADRSRLKMLGRLRPEDLDALYRGCRCVILPSVWQEPLSRVLFESARHSKPVIASCAGGNPEVIVHGRTGLLVPRSDPEALARSIAELVEDADLARRLGGAAADHVDSAFNAEASLDRLLEYYRQLRAFHDRR